MAHLIGAKIKVADYEAWKASFDGSLESRRAAGEKSWQLFRSASDPNELTLLCEWDSPERAQAYLDSEELRQAQATSGVTAMPETWVLELLDEG